MPVGSLQLPVIQNWSCHNCGGCCRQHLITVTQAERDRILGQNWQPSDGIPAGQPVVVKQSGSPWNRRYRLAHRGDGACVFLREDGLCRIHAKFGEAAKPLACRIYPYAFHPSGSKVAVSLRFSCPSVVANLGQPVTAAREELKRIAPLVVPDNVDQIPPPPINGSQRLDWSDFLKFVRALQAMIEDGDGSITDRACRSLAMVELIDDARFDVVRGERLNDFLDIIGQATGDMPVPEPAAPPSVVLMQFRLLVAQYARRDTVADLNAGLLNRWRLLRAAAAFASGRGMAVPLQDGFKAVPFAALEEPFGLPDEAEAILTRYLSVKLQGLHFCGPACYGLPLVEGFQTLLLIVPSICWIARWLAASAGRSAMTADDLRRAITIADHHHGYSDVFGTRGFRRRVKSFATMQAIGNLLQWYAR